VEAFSQDLAPHVLIEHLWIAEASKKGKSSMLDKELSVPLKLIA